VLIPSTELNKSDTYMDSKIKNLVTENGGGLKYYSIESQDR